MYISDLALILRGLDRGGQFEPNADEIDRDGVVFIRRCTIFCNYLPLRKETT